jgi:membrane protease YdiL (CAAX protease family)
MSWRTTKLLAALLLLVVALGWTATVADPSWGASGGEASLDIERAVESSTGWEAKVHRLIWGRSAETASQGLAKHYDQAVTTVSLQTLRRMTSLRLVFLGVAILGLFLLVHRIASGALPLRPSEGPQTPHLRVGLGIFVRAELGGEMTFLALFGATLLLALAGAEYPFVLGGWHEVLSSVSIGCLLLILIRKHPTCVPPLTGQLGVRHSVGWALILFGLTKLGTLAIGGFSLVLGTRGAPAVGHDSSTLTAYVLSLLVLAPPIEEVSFRWLLFGSLRSNRSFLFAAILSSTWFSVTHFQSISDGVVLAWFGLVMAFGLEHARALAPLIIAHALHNLEVCGLTLAMSGS